MSNNSRDNVSRIVACIALLISVLTFLFGDNIAGRIYISFQPKLPNNATIIEGIIAVLNVALAAFVLIDIWILRPIKIPLGNSLAMSSFKQLIRGWALLWATWLLLYICLGAHWLKLISGEMSTLAWYVADGLNMINGFFFFYLFFVLDQPSVSTKSEPDRARAFHFNIFIAIASGVTALITSGVVSSYSPENEPNGGTLVQKLVGAYTAMGMAFFFGRLDSHYLRVSRIVMAPLYLYVVIQLFWGRSIFAGNMTFNKDQVAVFGLALVLKFVIFLTLSTWIRDGRFIDYIVKAEEGLRQQNGS